MLNYALVAAVAIAVLAPISAHAEKQVMRTVKELSDFPELEKKAKEVCGSKVVLSDKLKAACASGAFPSVTKAGLFRNTGIGAELNTLMRQATADNQGH